MVDPYNIIGREWNDITKLISLDTSSSKTGWAFFIDAKYVTHGLIDLSKDKLTSDERIKKMCLQIVEVLMKYKPDIIVVEKMNVSRNMNAVRVLCRAIDAAYHYSILNDVFYYEMQASEWRATLGMQAKSRKRDEYKQLSMQFVEDKLNIKVTDDEADSFCIGMAYIKKFS